jgi:hypothetical protein
MINSINPLHTKISFMTQTEFFQTRTTFCVTQYFKSIFQHSIPNQDLFLLQIPHPHQNSYSSLTFIAIPDRFQITLWRVAIEEPELNLRLGWPTPNAFDYLF